MIAENPSRASLTALDALDEATLGARPTLSHITARLEIENLLGALGLGGAAAGNEVTGANRAAA